MGMGTHTPFPRGTVSFLFTDIEGSTRLWEQQPEAMRLALARHDALLRGAIETNDGCVFKTIGDQFCAAFATAPQAVAAALAAQRALHARPGMRWGRLLACQILTQGRLTAGPTYRCGWQSTRERSKTGKATTSVRP